MQRGPGHGTRGPPGVRVFRTEEEIRARDGKQTVVVLEARNSGWVAYLPGRVGTSPHNAALTPSYTHEPPYSAVVTDPNQQSNGHDAPGFDSWIG